MISASTLALVFVAAALASAALTAALMPLLRRYALARPNARSSHRVPTPQGAGIAVIAAALIAAGIALAGGGADRGMVATLCAATLALAAVGAFDDIRPLPVLLRLGLQMLAVGAVLWALPTDLRLVPWLPHWLESLVLLLAGVWFVNLTNFMDGIDWITVAEMIPLCGGVVLIGWGAGLPPPALAVGAALAGALAGFAPYNMPVAKVFLGDVGSLPIGLLTGFALLELAQHHAIAAALLLPLYYLADATLTLLRRAARREPVWTAHRSHFYQRATDNGFRVIEIVRTIFALNLLLCALAAATLLTPDTMVHAALVAAGGLAVAIVLRRFSRPRPGGIV